jgi:hypothetical protein
MRTRSEAARAELFFADLIGRPHVSRRGLAPAAIDAEEEELWSEAVAELPERYRAEYGFAQIAEQSLDAKPSTN